MKSKPGIGRDAWIGVARGIALAVLAWLALGFVLFSCSDVRGATLRVRATAPTTLNDGTCDAPIFSVARDSIWLVFDVQGRAPDSVRVAPGDSVTRAWTVAPGDYVVRCYARNSAGAGCKTSIVAAAPAPPASPSLQQIP